MQTKKMLGGLTAAMLALVGVVGVGLATADDDEPARPTDSITMTSDDDRIDDAGGDDSTPAQQTGVSADQATEIAKQQVPGGRVTEVESEQEHGRQVWSVELEVDGTEHEVYVDADTGDVVQHETEDDDHDDSDHDSDDDDDDRS